MDLKVPLRRGRCRGLEALLDLCVVFCCFIWLLSLRVIKTSITLGLRNINTPLLMQFRVLEQFSGGEKGGIISVITQFLESLWRVPVPRDCLRLTLPPFGNHEIGEALKFCSLKQCFLTLAAHYNLLVGRGGAALQTRSESLEGGPGQQYF